MQWLLKLYPKEWRDRYGEEMLAILEDHKMTPATVYDLVLGAIDANLNYHSLFKGETFMAGRRRSGIIMMFCSFMLFGVGWGMIGRITDPLPDFQAVSKIHAEFGVLFDSIFIVGCIAFIAFFIGGLPLLFISIKRAIKNNQKEVLMPFWVAFSSLLVFITATTAMAIVQPQNHIILYLLGYLILTAILLIVGTVAVSLVLAKTEFKLSELKFIFIPEVVILFGMVVSVILAAILMIAITINAPQLFATQDVGNNMFITGLVMMALSCIFAAMGLSRGSLKGLDHLTNA